MRPAPLLFGMTAPEIRVLQEFRRLEVDTVPAAVIQAIRHPVTVGEPPADRLVTRGLLVRDESAGTYTLTQAGRDFLAIDARPDEPAGRKG